MHKSFREYLYAEHVIEILKKFGRTTRGQLQERDAETYWEDFRESDPRRALTRELCGVVAPQWITPEVSRHLEGLLEWEIGRGDSDEHPSGVVPTRGLSTDGWEKIRDGLADLWDWWADGTHLRPQPKRRRGSAAIEFDPPLVLELVEISSRLDTEEGRKYPIPVRTVAVDAHLGDAIFGLCNVVHFRVALSTGWMKGTESGKDFEPTAYLYSVNIRPNPAKLWDGASPEWTGPRRYQTRVSRDGRSWILFAPSGPDPKFFSNFCHRINADGWRPGGSFPTAISLFGLDLRATILETISGLKDTGWFFLNLSGARITGIIGGVFLNVLANNLNARQTIFWRAEIFSSVFHGADFTGSLQESLRIHHCDVRDAVGFDAAIQKTVFAQTAVGAPDRSLE